MEWRAQEALVIFKNFLGDPVHIDSERGAAKANQRYAEFLFAQNRSDLERINALHGNC